MPVFLIHVSGNDRPGIMEKVMQPLAAHRARVLDVGQAVIHNSLSLGLLVHFPEAGDHESILKDVLFAAHALGVTATFSPIAEDAYEQWVARQGEARHIITVFGPELGAEVLSRLSHITAQFGLNIAVITRLSGRASLREARANNACIELSVRGTPTDATALRREILTAAQELGVDIAIQRDDMYRRNRRMVAFDMDSTLIQTEVIDELALRHGVAQEVQAITRAAMNGELDFDESLRRRLALIQGLSASALEDIAQNLPLTQGAERLVRTLKTMGYKTVILSGGFTYVGERLRQRLGIDHVFANELEIENGVLTGKVKGPIVNGQRKAELLKQIATEEGIRLEQVIAVGDGANDLPMLNAAGLGIAFHAKPRVKESAEQQISTTGLDGILYLLGVRDRDVPTV